VNGADREAEKQLAAKAAAGLVQDGWTVGLGTGSTVAHLLPALAERKLDLRCIATSPATEERARALGLQMVPFDHLERLDIAIDGADEVDPSGWLIKGRGGAHTREKIVAAASDRFVVIVSSDKLVHGLSPPVPLELVPFGIAATLHLLEPVTLRDAPPSPDGGVIADHMGAVDDPARVAQWLSGVPGVVEHGLFAPALTTEVLIGRGAEVERRAIR
jgi:ribose 5-phosphate isomerase A